MDKDTYKIRVGGWYTTYWLMCPYYITEYEFDLLFLAATQKN